MHWSGSKSSRSYHKGNEKTCFAQWGHHEAFPECDRYYRDGEGGRGRRGADGLSLINTITGMKIDINRQKFVLANKTGGMSGPAIHPVAVRMVYQTAQAVRLPIVGMGGIMNAEDAIEMILAGATAVSVGTANFTNPHVTEEIVAGIRDYMERYQVADIRDLVGAVHE